METKNLILTLNRSYIYGIRMYQNVETLVMQQCLRDRWGYHSFSLSLVIVSRGFYYFCIGLFFWQLQDEMRKQAHLCPLFCQEIGKTRYINHYYHDFLLFLLAFFAIIQTRNNVMFFGKQVCNCIITNRQSNDDVLND